MSPRVRAYLDYLAAVAIPLGIANSVPWAVHLLGVL